MYNLSLVGGGIIQLWLSRNFLDVLIVCNKALPQKYATKSEFSKLFLFLCFVYSPGSCLATQSLLTAFMFGMRNLFCYSELREGIYCLVFIVLSENLCGLGFGNNYWGNKGKHTTWRWKTFGEKFLCWTIGKWDPLLNSFLFCQVWHRVN